MKLARKSLDSSHKHLEKVKERILEYLAVRKLQLSDQNAVSPTILCLVGPPGVGKTSIAQSIAEAVGRRFVRMSLGGLKDEAEIRGHRRTYVGAMPGRMINAIRQAGTDNPLILLDEIDKLGRDYRADPSSALLEILDPGQNVNFRDHYLELPYDFSKVLFVTTANDLDLIPDPLLDRLEIIQLEGYSEQEKLDIAKIHLWPKTKKQASFLEELNITDEGILEIIRRYTREAGVRSLERNLAAVLRKLILALEEGKSKPLNILDVEDVNHFLKNEGIHLRALASENPAGVITGLAWTAFGGDILLIEALNFPGTGKIEITGQLGNVMQESAKVALTFVRSISKVLGIEDNYFDKHDFHIHVPEGAVPKDGPSAGITLALAICSSILGKKVKSDIAMTGELSILGRVMAIGGLKEKVLAAKRYGIKKIYFPKENQKDLDQLNADIKEGLVFVPLANIRDLFKAELGLDFV